MKSRLMLSAAGLAILMSVAGLTSVDAKPVARKHADCGATTTQWTASASTAQPLSDRFTDFATTTQRNGWTGADSTYSVDLPGKRVWIFSDTFLGPVNPDGRRSLDTPFVNNSFVVQRGDQLSTVHGGTTEEPNGLVPPGDGKWWWFGAGVANPVQESLDVTAIQFAKTGDGPLDFAWQQTALARFDERTLELRSITPLPSGADIQWSSWVSRDRGYTYVYGVEDRQADKFMHVARTRSSLTGAWEFWTGSGWSATEADSARVLKGVANEYSVTPFEGGYLLVTQDTNEILSAKIKAYFSCSPTGPFVNPIDLYTTPETGEFGSYGNPNVFTYNAHEHPELRRSTSTGGSQLLVTYNVNSFESDDLYEDVTIYRPRFIDITVSTSPWSRARE